MTIHQIHAPPSLPLIWAEERMQVAPSPWQLVERHVVPGALCFGEKATGLRPRSHGNPFFTVIELLARLSFLLPSAFRFTFSINRLVYDLMAGKILEGFSTPKPGQ